ncbi:hypothetical protein H4219_000185 [Mycoemilia scoparia]|uniref:Nucleolar complex protein 3 homolog n=1 Tax=Mycoemilia scoparia TaxID=417184 RepID=A0A9W8ABT8_9FUNG|nr:hypothetical protein H4219_000185 [Mycoemilia scoparia]
MGLKAGAKGSFGVKAKPKSKGALSKKHGNSAAAGPKSKNKKHKPDLNQLRKDEEDEKDNGDGGEGVDEEDISFVMGNSGRLGFLKSMNVEDLEKKSDKKEKKDNYLDVVKGNDGKKSNQSESLQPGELTESEDDDLDEGISELEYMTSDEDDNVDDSSDLAMPDSGVDDDDTSNEELAKVFDDEKPSILNHKEKKALKRKTAMSDLMDYEKLPRKFGLYGDLNKKQSESTRLPIKDASGRLLTVEDEGSENDDAAEGEDGADSEIQPSASEGEYEDVQGVSEDQSEAASSEDDSQSVAVKDQRASHTVNDIDLSSLPKKQYVIARKIQLAEIAELITQNPEKNIGQMKKLVGICDEEQARGNIKVQHLGLLTQLAIYKDILPDYRIRELTAEEKATKVSKEVKAQRKFEELIVNHYKNFITQIHKIIVKATQEFKQPSFDRVGAEIAVKCVGELVTEHPHFNFRAELIDDLVHVYVQPSFRVLHPNYASIAKLGRHYTEQLFNMDISGEYAKESVECASKRIKRLGGGSRIDPSCLRPWLKLRLYDELSENPEDRRREEREANKRQREHERRKIMRKKGGSKARLEAKRHVKLSKKQIKIRKEQTEVERSMLEAEAEVSVEERTKWHEKTLSAVFVTYFRILKNYKEYAANNGNKSLADSEDAVLIPVVLEGLAKFAHLISVDFFPDLLKTLKSVIQGQVEKSVATMSTRSSLLCILTAVHILSGQGEALNLDLGDFYRHLYSLLGELSCRSNIESTKFNDPKNNENAGQDKSESEIDWNEKVRSEADLLFDCLNRMFFVGPKTNPQRVAAFMKRLMIASLYWPSKTAVRAIRFVHKLFIKYSKLTSWLIPEENAGDDSDNETTLVMNGVYRKELDDPEMCNPLATQLYEIHWLQTHHSADVRSAVGDLIRFAKQLLKRQQKQDSERQ